MQLRKDTVALRVRPRDGLKFFRRAGVRFPLAGNAPDAPPVIVPLESVTADQVQRFITEPSLVVEELDHLPDISDSMLYRTPEDMMRENTDLKLRVTALEAKVDQLMEKRKAAAKA